MRGAVVVLVAVLALAACGGDDERDSAPATGGVVGADVGQLEQRVVQLERQVVALQGEVQRLDRCADGAAGRLGGQTIGC